MQYVYAAMLLHSAGKEVDEAGLTGVLKTAGVEFDEARVKALVASIKNINIEEAIEKAAVAAPAAAPAGAAAGAEAADEEPEEDAGKKEEEAAAGLGALFG
ncbi:MAG: 50S ribosomal protein P1 [Candidatus Diapherotrites archaeon]|jgi:large subunit ribosomal protein L12|uniref:Large ribosomal subunit protein P1 n=1 Tax=Candidatus Iainarchaeum sp. TaxID=3101447 RepID=A0A8T5GEP8_9ARCH|nr:50S ribosomal protein P1 [Candidatus Diapherotrites archaeon]MBT7241045.1 50S ribosomal protein P1 [Candidatus Diapherotrites archaeon]